MDLYQPEVPLMDLYQVVCQKDGTRTNPMGKERAEHLARLFDYDPSACNDHEVVRVGPDGRL